MTKHQYTIREQIEAALSDPANASVLDKKGKLLLIGADFEPGTCGLIAPGITGPALGSVADKPKGEAISSLFIGVGNLLSTTVQAVATQIGMPQAQSLITCLSLNAAAPILTTMQPPPETQKH
jgi:hypothetical protein